MLPTIEHCLCSHISLNLSNPRMVLESLTGRCETAIQHVAQWALDAIIFSILAHDDATELSQNTAADVNLMVTLIRLNNIN